MKKQDLFGIGFLMLLLPAIYYPLLYTDYLYTDEAVQLWMYRKDPDFQMFTHQGRYLTELLFQAWFRNIDTIHEVSYVRLFSLLGWLLCTPVWYCLIRDIAKREALPSGLAFFATLYLVTSPQVSLYVSWASCMELFIANTAGLVSGYFACRVVQADKGQQRLLLALPALLSGLISLFSYQNGFGCFLLPFVMMLMADPRKWKRLVGGLAIYIGIYLVYYLLFKIQLSNLGYGTIERTRLYIAPWGKLKFLFTRPLAASFHFNVLFNEKSIAGFLIYAFLFAAWLVVNFLRMKAFSVPQRLVYLALVCMLFACIYLPSLVTRENYASNRTLLALNMAVFVLVAETIMYLLRNRSRSFLAYAFGVFLVANAVYNFHFLFLRPVRTEYALLRDFIAGNYAAKTTIVHFIRPEEDFFVRRYGITRSWDEFGVASSFFSWVPEFLTKQLVYEKTGNAAAADRIAVQHWLGREAYLQAGAQVSDTVLVVDAPKIMSGH